MRKKKSKQNGFTLGVNSMVKCSTLISCCGICTNDGWCCCQEPSKSNNKSCLSHHFLPRACSSFEDYLIEGKNDKLLALTSYVFIARPKPYFSFYENNISTRDGPCNTYLSSPHVIAKDSIVSFSWHQLYTKRINGLWYGGRVFALTMLSVRVRVFIKVFMRIIYNPSSIIK